jgi:uncharacterized protein YkwD
VGRGLVVLLVACGGAAAREPPVAVPVTVPATVPVTVAAAAAAKRDDLGFCVEEINRYRGRAKKPPLERSADLEAFAAEGAKVDSAARQAHHHFSRVPYPHPYREMGENEIPWWPAAQYGSVADVLRTGLAGMWDEGPGGGHYENLVGRFSYVGCGIHVAGGEVTVVMDFLRLP